MGVSFGACRELAFLKSKTGESTPDESCRIYFPQPNNTCFTFGRDVNINFKHGINALPDNEHDSKGRISILVWGWTDNIIEEIGSPVIVADQAMKTQSSKETKIIQRKKARIDRRKEKRKALMQKKKAEQKATPEAGNDTTISQPDTTEAVIHA